MKKRDLENELKKLISQPVPRHKEINEMTAKGIIRKARNNPPKN